MRRSSCNPKGMKTSTRGASACREASGGRHSSEHAQEHIMRVRKRTEFGQYVIADPEICHGQLTFKGTRILVADVLYLLAKDWDWDRISAAYGGRLSREAIAEAIALARESLLERAEKRRRAA